MFADSFFYYLVLVGFAAGLMDAAVGGGGLLQEIQGFFPSFPLNLLFIWNISPARMI